MGAQDLGSQAAIAIEADGLPNEALQGIVAELKLHTGQTPSVGVRATDRGIQLVFAVVQKGGQGPRIWSTYQ
jgi:hypothetical protein